MNDYLLYGIVALIVIIVLAIVFTYIIKNRHPKQIKAGDIPLDINMLKMCIRDSCNCLLLYV